MVTTRVNNPSAKDWHRHDSRRDANPSPSPNPNPNPNPNPTPTPNPNPHPGQVRRRGYRLLLLETEGACKKAARRTIGAVAGVAVKDDSFRPHLVPLLRELLIEQARTCPT